MLYWNKTLTHLRSHYFGVQVLSSFNIRAYTCLWYCLKPKGNTSQDISLRQQRLKDPELSLLPIMHTVSVKIIPLIYLMEKQKLYLKIHLSTFISNRKKTLAYPPLKLSWFVLYAQIESEGNALTLSKHRKQLCRV